MACGSAARRCASQGVSTRPGDKGPPRTRDARPAAAAFTLIELLVVMAIMAILAAILFPVFSKARESGRRATCLNNIKQIAIATLMYTDDWDGTLPSHLWEGAILEGEPWSPIAVRVNAYLQHLSVWECPSAHADWNGEDPSLIQEFNGGYWNLVQKGCCDGTRGYLPFPAEWEGLRVTYDWSQLLYAHGFNYLTNSGTITPLRLSVIANPARVGLLADAAASEVMCGPEAPWPDVCAIDCTPSLRTSENARHHGGSNIAFCDGHAKWYHSNHMFAHCGEIWQYKEPPDDGLAQWIIDSGRWTP